MTKFSMSKSVKLSVIPNRRSYTNKLAIRNTHTHTHLCVREFEVKFVWLHKSDKKLFWRDVKPLFDLATGSPYNFSLSHLHTHTHTHIPRTSRCLIPYPYVRRRVFKAPEAKRQHTFLSRSKVNFTNILRAAFSPISFCHKITSTSCECKKAL